MLKIAKDILFGILINISITIIEFIITLPFGEPGNFTKEGYTYFISRELLLTSLPVVLLTYMFTWILKTKSKSEALRRSIIWTIIIFLNYLLIGIGNKNLGEIFGGIGVYVLLISSFVGPIIYSKNVYKTQ
ncbi:hypothetical protein NNC19_18915 [Clostridium sp. SHJSY1]|uniref:hypothetical protein n=1 Tax=Clostridium sp. SHJSY1 TaxID=2942483 RepID=UPI0028755936|nr:hypothetical protein [Clostridium sp. SHJSY1]MDS0527766.1 hypothetical protein [Clostridium sp. SHJSY1]